jgi:L-alanine-DL-glutamate epimerase-like enolase superfamily enzyme
MISSKIVSISAKLEKIALKKPFITALRRVENVEFVRIYMVCEDTSFSIGEAPATKAITGEGIEEILDSIESVKSKLQDKTPTQALDTLHSTCQDIGSSAKAALDMAIVLLLAKQNNQKLYQYLGLERAKNFKTDLTISFKDSKEMLKDSIVACENGLDILKIKLAKDIKHSIEVVKIISMKLPHAKLIIDANQAWSIEDSFEFLDSVKGIDIELIEQPLKADDIAGLKELSNYSTIPILADESVFTLEDAKKVIESKSADMINIKLMKCGGVTKAVEIFEYAKSKGVKCMLGSMLEGPYSINVALHLAMVYSDIISYVDLDSPLLYKEFPTELEFRYDGCLISLV